MVTQKTTRTTRRRPLKELVRRLWRRSVPVLQQMDAAECGAACLAMILGYYGRKTSVSEVRQLCGVGRDGLSALTVVKAARQFGLRVRALSVPLEELRFVMLPAIVHWEFNHFLVLERWSPKHVDVVDPSGGRRRLAIEEFSAGFTGIVIVCEPGAQFSRASVAPKVSLWTYARSLFRMPTFLLQILGASLFLQLLGLILPLLTKVFVDQVIPAQLADLIPMIGVGIIIIVLAQVITTFLRALLLTYLQARVDMQMLLGFFEHMLTLPYRFFQQRSSGDLLMRLNSNMVIRETLTGQLISTILDGGTVVIYLLLLLSQSLAVTFTVLIVGLLQIGMMLLTSSLIYQLNQRDLAAQGKAQGYMAEALVGMATLKASGSEQRALHRWSNLFFEQLNVSVRRDTLSATLDTAMGGLRLLTPLLLLWIGTIQVLQGTMSVGTMLALNALAAAFLTPLSSLASSGQRLQLVRAHFERIADVVGAEPEQDIKSVQQPPQLSGRIALKGVSFRYDPNAPWVLHDMNIEIKPGQKVALVGRTGSGKSTLGKLLLGLYLPTQGEILYDDLSLRSMNYQAVRSQFGVVLQESTIFSGSIRENIALNTPEMSLEQVIKAAMAAAIHGDISQMPMGYETMVSEGGSAISGGQRQRLAIARALASKPAIMLLDEATSHLDVVTEQIVEHSLNAVTGTRIVIAHRLSTVRNADLILVLENGKIVERGTHDELMALRGHYVTLVESQAGEEQSKTGWQPTEILDYGDEPTLKLNKAKLKKMLLAEIEKDSDDFLDEPTLNLKLDKVKQTKQLLDEMENDPEDFLDESTLKLKALKVVP